MSKLFLFHKEFVKSPRKFYEICVRPKSTLSSPTATTTLSHYLNSSENSKPHFWNSWSAPTLWELLKIEACLCWSTKMAHAWIHKLVWALDVHVSPDRSYLLNKSIYTARLIIPFKKYTIIHRGDVYTLNPGSAKSQLQQMTFWLFIYLFIYFVFCLRKQGLVFHGESSILMKY